MELHHQENLPHRINWAVQQSQFVLPQMSFYKIYRLKCRWWSLIPAFLVMRKLREIFLLKDQVETILLRLWQMSIVLHLIEFDQRCFLKYLSFHHIMTSIIKCFIAQTIQTLWMRITHLPNLKPFTNVFRVRIKPKNSKLFLQPNFLRSISTSCQFKA